jgi:hypothetical protein
MHFSEAIMMRQAQKLLGQPAMVQHSKISLTFFTMLLLKVHKHCAVIEDDCSRKIIEDLILRLQSTSTPPKSKSRSYRGGSASNNNSGSRRRHRRTAENLIAETKAQMLKNSLATETNLRIKMQDMYLEQIKRASTGLTVQEHLSIMIDSGAKAMIPAVFVKMFLMLTIDLIIGGVQYIGTTAKSGIVAAPGLIGQGVAQGTEALLQNFGILNLAWNLMTITNKAIISGSNAIFGSETVVPPSTVTQNATVTYLQNVDQATDSILSILSNPSFSTKVSGSVFVLVAIMCYNVIVFMRKRKIVSEGEEAKKIISAISKMERYQPIEDYTISDALLGAAPIVASMGAMAFTGNPQFSTGLASLTNVGIRRAMHSRRQIRAHKLEQARIQAEYNGDNANPELRELETLLPMQQRRPPANRRKESRQRSASNNENSPSGPAAEARPTSKKSRK